MRKVKKPAIKLEPEGYQIIVFVFDNWEVFRINRTSTLADLDCMVKQKHSRACELDFVFSKIGQIPLRPLTPLSEPGIYEQGT